MQIHWNLFLSLFIYLHQKQSTKHLFQFINLAFIICTVTYFQLHIMLSYFERYHHTTKP